MPRKLLSVLLIALSVAVAAQQNTSKSLGKVTMRNNIDLSVSVDSTGTIILATPTHSMFVTRKIAGAFRNALDSILVGMRDLEAKSITVVDYRVLGKIIYDGTTDFTKDGIIFRLALNSTKDDKVLLIIFSTLDKEDLLFTSASLAQLADLVTKGIKSVSDFGQQYESIESVINEINAKAF